MVFCLHIMILNAETSLVTNVRQTFTIGAGGMAVGTFSALWLKLWDLT